MDFAWNKEDVELYDRVLSFARSLEGRRREDPGAEPFPTALWRECGKFGLLGLCVPEEYGGMGLGALSTARALEAFGRGYHDMGFAFAMSAHLFACVMPIVEHGTASLKERVLPPLCDGRWIGANAITEAEAGSDAFALASRAVSQDSGYALTGVKSYVTNGPVADVMVFYASTNPAHGHLGLSAFLVEKDAEGVRVGKPFEKIGLETALISSVYLEDCPVSTDHLLGREGAGAQVFKSSMYWERACLFAGYLGTMERQLEQVVTYANERRQYGKRIGHYQAVSHRIADMKLRLESARLLLYRACWLFDRGEDAELAISLAKTAVSEAAVQSGLDTIRIHGGIGVAKEAGVENHIRDAIPSTVFSGTSEIQRNLIARALGL